MADSDYVIHDIQTLRDIYGQPSSISTQKMCRQFDQHTVQFLQLSTFIGVAIYLPNGEVEVLMLSGLPTFINIIDDKTLSISLQNNTVKVEQVLREEHEFLKIGLIFIIPGVNETVRLKGVIDIVKTNHQQLVIMMDSCFFHCAKAFMRSKLWAENDQIDRQIQASKWLGAREFVCVHKQAESETISSFYLKPVDGEVLPTYLPGQHVTVIMDIPNQSKEVTRTYTLSDRPDLDYYRITVKKEPQRSTGSRFLHEDFKVGDTVKLRAPSGQFYLDETSKRPVVLLSGGVGLTPMIAILNHWFANNNAQEIWFIHATLSGREHAMGGYIKQLEKKYRQLNVHICYERPDVADELGVNYDTEGRISIELLKSLLPWGDFDFYLCGPPPFMDAIGQSLMEHSVHLDRIKWEAFSNNTTLNFLQKSRDHNSICRVEEKTLITKPCTVLFKKAGIKAKWDNAEQSILELAEKNGLQPRHSCRSGDCHSCLYQLLDGEVHYDIQPDESPKGNDILVCIAKPIGNVVIDL